MFQHDRPSPNVIGMYENTVRDIAIGAGLTYGFCYDMTGLTGPAVRQCSAQDARAIQVWQQMLMEQKLDPIVMLLLGTAIANGELPYIDTWMLWSWFFPPKPTIDVGRESDANIQEIDHGINTGANVVSEAGLGDIQDVITQCGHETAMKIEAAMAVAKQFGLDWQEVYALMIPPPRGKGGGMGGGALGAAMGAANLLKNGQNADQEGATQDPTQLDDESNMSQNGHRDRPYVVQNFYGEEAAVAVKKKVEQHEFYRPGQLRDEAGRFADEGKGAGEAGYEHPDVADLKGLDKRLVDYHIQRPLARGAENVQSIRQRVPDIHYVMYSKTPFFQKLNELQGTPDPENIPVEDYAAARDKLFQSQPVQQLPIKGMIATQPVVNAKTVDRTADRAKTGEREIKNIYAVHYGNKNFIMDGHHALSAAATLGRDTVGAHVVNIEPPKSLSDVAPPKVYDLHRYMTQVQATPEWREALNEQRKLMANTGGHPTFVSKNQNSVNGVYTPERQKIHDDYVKSRLNPKAAVPEGQRPTFTMVIGTPGAGKTTQGKPFADKMTGENTYVNPDDAKTALPGVTPKTESLYHEESSEMSKQLQTEAVAARHNIVWDSSGKNGEKLMQLTNALHDKGYNIKVVLVSTPMQVAVQRAVDRYYQGGKKSGRWIPLDFVTKDVDEKPNKSYDLLKTNKYVTQWVKLDTTGKSPTILDQGSREPS